MQFAALLLVTALQFPSSSQTSWMRPESFRIHIGMTRAEAIAVLRDGGWEAKPGTAGDQLVVDYGDDKALTLDFRRERLRSARFELYAFLPDVRKAFEEQRSFLAKTLGEPRRARSSRSLVLYDNVLPNVLVVVSDSADSENGRKGIGLLAVRYFDPTTPK